MASPCSRPGSSQCLVTPRRHRVTGWRIRPGPLARLAACGGIRAQKRRPPRRGSRSSPRRCAYGCAAGCCVFPIPPDRRRAQAAVARRGCRRRGRRGRGDGRADRLVAAPAVSSTRRSPALTPAQGQAQATAAAQTAANGRAAAAWIAAQVSGQAVIGCDPAMCAAILAAGYPGGGQVILHQA